MPSQAGSRAWHMEQLPITVSYALSKPAAEAYFCSYGVGVVSLPPQYFHEAMQWTAKQSGS